MSKETPLKFYSNWFISESKSKTKKQVIKCIFRSIYLNIISFNYKLFKKSPKDYICYNFIDYYA